MALAMGACPWPRESAWKSLLIPELSASCSSAPVGSTPGDRTKIRGVQLVDSSTTWEEDGGSKVNPAMGFCEIMNFK